MQVNEIDKVVKKLNAIEQVFGIGGVILVIALAVVLILTWKYLVKRSELIAQEVSEQSLKKFQSNLDKDLVKFKTNHQKQVDAIHDTFQKFQRMTSVINYMMKGEKFTQHIKPDEEVRYLINFRHEFKDIYHQNRLLFPKQLCEKIDALIPTVDEFIETYNGGLFPEQTEEEMEFNAQNNDGYYIAGIWNIGAFEGTLTELEQISTEIENEFRKIYGTND
ncbi:hypothetical protein B0I21_105196 [Sphingobacterium paludis]|uniref:Uncharacterized protein n=2 Tax=Sphingobacterium paludis TaxID=1476465 RepID=A0A4R7CX18_9SPHI|nr:hypothetical protein B0I21_105196 [Sphingobacterium paludis]